MPKQRFYTPEFKQAMIDYYYVNPRSLRLIAEDFNVPLFTFSKWLEIHQKEKHTPRTI